MYYLVEIDTPHVTDVQKSAFYRGGVTALRRYMDNLWVCRVTDSSVLGSFPFVKDFQPYSACVSIKSSLTSEDTKVTLEIVLHEESLCLQFIKLLQRMKKVAITYSNHERIRIILLLPEQSDILEQISKHPSVASITETTSQK